MDRPIEILSDTGLENLRYAIVRQAIEDYHRSLRFLHGNSSFYRCSVSAANYDIQAAREKAECEQFFRSRRFGIICDLDGERLIATIRSRSYNRPLMLKKDRRGRAIPQNKEV